MAKGPKMGVCPKCKEYGPTSNHHIYPKRFFGERGPIVMICEDCHRKLELYIPHNEIMPADFYPMIFDWFCNKED